MHEATHPTAHPLLSEHQHYSPEKALGDYVKDYTGADNITVAESESSQETHS